jgi:asparagine synthase (glutamine-hydrolysing)
MSGSLLELISNKGISKFLLKKYLDDIIPMEYRNSKKQGGFVPLNLFLNDKKIRNNIFNIIRYSSFAKVYLDLGILQSILKNYDDLLNRTNVWFWQKQIVCNRILNLLTISIWWELYIQNHSINDLSDLVT